MAALAVSGGLVCALMSPALADRMVVGAVENVQERAEAKFDQGLRMLDRLDPVLFEDLLRTGADARLLARLADGSEITLGENAEMLIDDFVYDPANGKGEMFVRVVKGAFLFVGGEIENVAGGKGVQIATAVGTLGIRGTKLWGGPIDDGFGVLVLDGTVEITTAHGTVMVTAGTATMVRDQRAEAPAPWPRSKIARAFATIRFRDEYPFSLAPPNRSPRHSAR